MLAGRGGTEKGPTMASPHVDGRGEVLDVKSVFIGAGCNRIVNNVSWGPSRLVSFGAQNAVALFNPQDAQIWTTLPGHKAVVNCTWWLPSKKDAVEVQNADKHYLLSGSADGVILLWEIHLKERKWRQMLQAPESHKKGVTCITGIFISPGVAIFASTSSDGTVLVWELILPANVGGDCKLTCLEHIFVGSKPMVALSLAKLPGPSGNLVLAMGGLDHKVHLYCGDNTGKFFHACELKGHTDWIRSLDFSLPICSESGENSIFLVSSSQDKNIRIWKIGLLFSPVNHNVQHRKDDRGLASYSYIEGPLLVVGSSSYQISLESLLIGHEDWVYSVEWHPPLPSCSNGIERHQPLSILSASMDKTMMIWRPERTTGIWVNAVTVGELGHCALGFYGGHWGPKGESILAHGYGGSFHLWRDVGHGSEDWQPQKVPSGHFAAVSDISWAQSGEYILSVSHDQTARIFAPWTDELCQTSWHEIARPQVHGHDINCVTIIRGKGNHRYVSGADEKVARVFEAPLSFLKSLKHANQKANYIDDLSYEVQVLGANMSALGLSQKPIYVYASNKTTDHSTLDVVDSVPDAVPTVLTQPPVEEQLAWHTLWPESHKLYGHGNELFSSCCDHEGKLVASSCKAQSAAVAEIWLWEVGSWKAVCRLHSHSLTVTQMEFSQDDSFLLAVSRDRHFSVFSINRSGNEVSYQLVSRQEAHKRIIWACSWNPSGHQFATGSRDKTVKIWSIEENDARQILALPQFNCSVTALSWAGHDRSCNMGFLSVGMENGLIEIWGLFGDGSTPSNFGAVLTTKVDPFRCHVSTVNRLLWRDVHRGNSSMMQLASCGADHCVRIFEISFG